MEQIILCEFTIISCSRRLCFSHGQVPDFIPSSLLLLQNSLSSLCSSSLPFHTSTHHTVFQKLLFWPLLTCFPPSDCSILLPVLSYFSQTIWFFISSASSALFLPLNLLLSHSNILLPIQHISCCFTCSFSSRGLSGKLRCLQQEEIQSGIPDVPPNLAFLVSKLQCNLEHCDLRGVTFLIPEVKI